MQSCHTIWRLLSEGTLGWLLKAQLRNYIGMMVLVEA